MTTDTPTKMLYLEACSDHGHVTYLSDVAYEPTDEATVRVVYNCADDECPLNHEVWVLPYPEDAEQHSPPMAAVVFLEDRDDGLLHPTSWADVEGMEPVNNEHIIIEALDARFGPGIPATPTEVPAAFTNAFLEESDDA